MTVETWGELIGALLGKLLSMLIEAVLLGLIIYVMWLFAAWVFNLWSLEQLITPFGAWQAAGLAGLIVAIIKR